MADSALLETIMVATEAKTEALLAAGSDLRYSTDAVIAACEGEIKHHYAGRITELGGGCGTQYSRASPKPCAGTESGGITEPAFFIFSRFKGEHWVEWLPQNCPYYPCHFPGQSCDFCYCPFYPCRNEELGEWAASSNERQGLELLALHACSMSRRLQTT